MSDAIKEELLHQFFDNELSENQASGVREKLASEPELASSLDDFAAIRALMQQSASDWRNEVDSDALFSRVEEQIGSADGVEAGQLEAITGGQLMNSFRIVGAGFAIAAAVLLGFLALPNDDAPGKEQAPIAAQQPDIEVGQPNEPVLVAALSRGTEVLEVDFGQNTGTIFEVEGSAGQPLAVVWISDEEVGLP